MTTNEQEMILPPVCEQAPAPAVPAGEEPAIVADSLFFAYRGHQAVSGVSFVVARRSIHGFVGPNGAGKTTTLKILSTLLRPYAGCARIFGQDIVKEYREVRARIGFMPDHFSMYRQMTVFEYLDFFAAAYGMEIARRDRVVSDVLALTDMTGRRDDLIRSLSRGMQQRVNLARVLVHDPELLLLDEPASGLDPRARIELMEILRELRRMGKTIFISSHILSELATLCDSFTIIDRGKIKYSGVKRGLLSREDGGRAFLLHLEAAHPPTEAALRALDGVAEVIAQENAAYRVTFNPESTDVNAILRAVIASKGRIVAVQEDGSQLNQAFMDLTEPGVPQ